MTKKAKLHKFRAATVCWLFDHFWEATSEHEVIRCSRCNSFESYLDVLRDRFKTSGLLLGMDKGCALRCRTKELSQCEVCPKLMNTERPIEEPTGQIVQGHLRAQVGSQILGMDFAQAEERVAATLYAPDGMPEEDREDRLEHLLREMFPGQEVSTHEASNHQVAYTVSHREGTAKEFLEIGKSLDHLVEPGSGIDNSKVVVSADEDSFEVVPKPPPIRKIRVEEPK